MADLGQQVAALRHENIRLRAMLASLEWAGTNTICGAAECPVCGEERGSGDTPTGTHRPTCHLAALLKTP